ncbi:hypothetical protein [Sagittula stellata]|uniref:SnoaL-like domain-containing protein n=1 Tax=Sagittula stellata (strain ATCC 700073 / DSM 11524 / E-37) TaxID=388399 RepID=A3K0K2_SAGS3|nr:hypothetical protein [Sagittula stellata]EBA09317.1 hypothetical protein SSE37_23784 [Sagittula stellata E-37]
MRPPAEIIVEDLLERTGLAIADRCFERFAECVCLPFVVETFEGRLRIETEASMRDWFNRNVDFYDIIGVTDMQRFCISASYRSDTMIVSAYESRLVQHGHRLEREPYMVYTEIRLVAGRWGVWFAQYAIADSDVHNRVLVQASARGALRDAPHPHDAGPGTGI